MLTLGALSFTTPLVLLGLAALPVLWWLLRVSPPAPRKIRFPALRLLLGITTREETPARMPWWLLLLRMALVTLVLLALAGPVWNADHGRSHGGPLVVAVDTGWAAAPGWESRRRVLDNVLGAAARERHDIVLIPTTAPHASTLTPVSAEEARRAADRLVPRPFAPDRAGLIAPLEALKEQFEASGSAARALWLSDGFDYASGEAFAAALAAIGPLTVMVEPEDARPLALNGPETQGDEITIPVIRAADGARRARAGDVTLLSTNGRLLATVPFGLESDATETTAKVSLPLNIRNRVSRIMLADPAVGPSAAGVFLLDGRWRRRPVGLISGAGAESTRPLLSDLYYLRRALAPYADLREGPLADVLASGLAVLILSDVGQIVGDDLDRVSSWVDEGGVLVRFAGPRLAGRSDDLIPVALRRGGRALGGTLSWDTPQKLAPFPPSSPFAGLALRDEIIVERQVLAEPSPDLDARTWARLADGTPLVTADRRGRGWIVLVHVTANQDWSNLPLSGLYVDMLRRLLDLSSGVSGGVAAGSGTAARPPVRLLDGSGSLVLPTPEALPLDPAQLKEPPDYRNPPGLYGQDGAELAYNLAPAPGSFRVLPALGRNTRISGYDTTATADLRASLFLVILLMLLADLGLTVGLTGEAARLKRLVGGAATALTLLCLLPDQAQAQEAEDAKATALTRTTHLAYVVTGDGPSDAIARQGLAALSQVLAARTAFEPGQPVGVDPATDPLVFYPLIYWRITDHPQPIGPEALQAVDVFMKNGGTVLFDTADHGDGVRGLDAAGLDTARGRLREILDALDLPPLSSVPPGHVLRRSFYLLPEFPGRFAGGQIWVQALSTNAVDATTPLAGAPTRHDGVTPVIIGSNDWAGAWARDRTGNPIAATVPGGERQREMAYRFGINLVMYTLSGNYKADQVHLPAILERLSQ